MSRVMYIIFANNMVTFLRSIFVSNSLVQLTASPIRSQHQ